MPIVILKRSKSQVSFRGGKESSPKPVPTSAPSFLSQGSSKGGEVSTSASSASAPKRNASAPTQQAVPNSTSAANRVAPLAETKMRSISLRITSQQIFEKGLSSNPMTSDDIETIVKQGWKEEMLISESYRSSILGALEPSGKGRITTFHYFAGHHQHSMRISFSAGAVFGAIHTIGWNFSFPSKIEAILWRVASTAAAALPAILLVPLLLTIWGGPLYTWLNKIRGKSVGRVFGPADWIVMILYASMRLYLLLALFITFRSQPEEIYATVSWSRYIPHFT